MATMPDHIVKPPFLKKLDTASNAYLATGLPDANAVLGDLQSMNLVDVGLKYGWISTVAPPGQMTEEQHLRKHWLNDPPGSGWWPQIANIAEILQQGFITVVNLVKTVTKPIDAYWLCHGPQNAGAVKVDAAVSSNQITVLIGTPMPPMFATPPPLSDLSIWTTYYDAAQAQVVSRPILHVVNDFYPLDSASLSAAATVRKATTATQKKKK